MVIAMKPIVLPSDTERKLVEIFAALGNPARMHILEILAQNPESIVADLVEQLPLAQSTISQHLQVLQRAGLIYNETEGVRRCCRIDVNVIAEFAQHVVGWTHSLATRTAHGCLDGGSSCNR
jgi:ArsR family transcriptional regulator, arsenate/arsenite/antimonite-responsive transcriptional repressor